MELDALGCKVKMCWVWKRVKTKISGGWRCFCLLSVALWECLSLGRVWAAWEGKFTSYELEGFSRCLMTCPDLAQSRGIWPALALILWTCADVDGALPWSTNSIILCSVLCAVPFPSFPFCRRVWRPVPRQTSGGRGLYFKIIYCRIPGALVRGGASPKQKRLFWNVV